MMSNQTYIVEESVRSVMGKQSLTALEGRYSSDVAEAKIKSEDLVAIIGMACRFPGANDYNQFWVNLEKGINSVTEVPSDRWDIDKFYSPNPDEPNKSISKWGGFIEDVDKFDALFFGISPREAKRMDPQQRLMMELTWSCIEDSGYSPANLLGSNIGVFIGVCNFDYKELQEKYEHNIEGHTSTGTYTCIIPNRISYFFNFHGPSVPVDTACSSSLVAIHQAINALKENECEMALVGGVSVLCTPTSYISFSKLGMLSPEGKCKTFDAKADGYVRGEGAGVILLKPLRKAIKDKDHIYGVIKGSAVNHGGHTRTLTSPNAYAQAKVIRAAYTKASISPNTVSYIEAHGTGTPLGDPIEINALKRAFTQLHQQYGIPPSNEPYCGLGTVKTNIGHLESAAGVAGVIKVLLAMKHKKLPRITNYQQLNPRIQLDGSPFYIVEETKYWQQLRTKAGEIIPRRASVSSFGFGGVNAHVVLEEAPAPDFMAAEVERPRHLLSLSAKSEKALGELAQGYEAFLQSHQEVSLADVCFTANTGRTHFDHRLSVVAPSTVELREQLSAFAAGRETAGLVSGQVTSKSPKIAFLFTGQGSQYVGMGRQLYETQPTFREILDRCDEILRPYLEKPLLEVLYPETTLEVTRQDISQHQSHNLIGSPSPLDETAYAQPALFALEYAVAELWKSWGINPQVVMGHSVGEYVAACVAGVFSLEDGLKLISERGRLMQALPQTGEMVSVLADAARVSAAIQPYAHKVAIAALNGPNSIVISGERQAIASVVAALEAEGIKTTKLNVSHAFHSPLIEPMLADFERVARDVTYSQPRLGLISNVTGGMATTEIATPEYWCCHIRQPVRFAASIETLHQQGYEVFVEIGPKPTLLGMGRHCLPEKVGVWLPSLRQGHSDWQQMLHSLEELYVRGVSVDWSGFDRDYPRRRLQLPTYPFQRSRYWVETTQKKQLEQKSEGLPLWESVVAVGSQQAQQGPLDLALHTHSAKLQGLDRLTTAYIISAFQVLGVYGQPGERHSVDTLLAQLNISPTYGKLLSRWLERLANAGVLQQQKDVFVSPRPLPQGSVDSLLPQVREQASNAPHLLEFVQRCGENLADVLVSKVKPVDLLFPGGSFETAEGIYQHAPEARYFNGIARAVLESVVKTLPQGRQLRILEVGAGTGGTTASLLPVLPVNRTSYWYTDLSELFLARAKQKFKTYPFVRYGLLDIEQNAQEQGYKYHSFDVVVAANVLHATLNLGETLQHVRSLLAPGGLLLIWEVTHPLSWLDITFGLFEGWQRHDDHLRQDNPLLSTAQWEEALRSHGFEEVVAFPETGSVAEVLEQHILVAQAPVTLALGEGDTSAVVAERNGATNPSVASFSASVSEPEPAASQTRDELLAAKPEKRQLLLKFHLGQQVARVLGLSASLLDLEQPFNNLGLDSLMAVELTSWLKNELGVDVSTIKLLEGLSIAQLAELVLEQLALASLIPAVSPSPNFKDDMEEITL